MLIYPTPSHIAAFSTTRDGGVSIAIPQLFMPHHQVHETKTLIIDNEFVHKNPLEQVLALDGVDALSTHLPNVCVCVKTADCIPVLLWDDYTQVVSAVHAGWKGTQKRIVESNIEVLKYTYSTQTTNLHAIIGPGIGVDSFEVGDEVYEQFAQAGFPMEKLARRYPLMNNQNNTDETRWHIDLWECNRLQLIEKGVRPENIYVSGIDTYQSFNRFFSARRHLNGRIINGIMRKT
jgi:YfiH family protein